MQMGPQEAAKQAKMMASMIREARAPEKKGNPKQTAEAQAQFQSIIYPYVEAIQSEKDPSRRDAMTQQLLAQAKEYDFPLDQFINSPAFRESMGRSKEAAKLQHGAAANETRVVLQGMGDTRADKDRQARRDIADLDRAVKKDQVASGLTPPKLAAFYQKQAEELEAQGETEEADLMYAKARRAALLGAMGTPAAGKESVDVGKVSGMPTTTPVDPNANAPSRVIKIERDKDGKLIKAP